jgi:hypothetical protein
MKRLLSASLLAVLLLTVPAFAHESRHNGRGDDAVTVMTRSMYFGADLTPALVATTVPELIAAATHIFDVVNGSDVANRIEKMAGEIARTKPDLVGLQEVALWRTQFPPDFSPTPNAMAGVVATIRLP